MSEITEEKFVYNQCVKILVAGIRDVGRHLVSWQGLANKSSWDPRWSIGRRDAHQTWDCRTNHQKKPLIICSKDSRADNTSHTQVLVQLRNCLEDGSGMFCQFAWGGLGTSIKHRLEIWRGSDGSNLSLWERMPVSRVFLFISAVLSLRWQLTLEKF